MNRKPDVIQSLVFLFVAGLVVSGVTHLGAWQSGPSVEQAPALQADSAHEPAWNGASVWAFNASPAQQL